MIICLFGTRYRPDADLDLERELLADLYARLSDWPGFPGFRERWALDRQTIVRD